MNRKMRRFRQKLSDEQTIEILERNTNGTLALIDDEGYPYALPISYVYDDGKIYFHSAVTGHKIDAIRANPVASFAVIDQDEILPEKFTTCFKSAVCFGRIRILEDRDEMIAALDRLARKYSPNVSAELKEAEIAGAINRVTIIELDIEEMSGKQGKELLSQNA